MGAHSAFTLCRSPRPCPPQRSTASCHRSRSRTAQRTTSPPETTWWTSACHPPPTDRNPTSCSAARTCDRPAPGLSVRARPRPPPTPHCPVLPAHPLRPSVTGSCPPIELRRTGVERHLLSRPRKARSPGCCTCSPWVPVGISAGRGGWQDGPGWPEAKRMGMPSSLLQFSTVATGEQSPPSLSGQLAQLAPGPHPEPHSRLKPEEQGARGRADGHSWLSASRSPAHSQQRTCLRPLPCVRDSSSCL